MIPARGTCIHQRSEQMAQRKGLGKEIAARSLVTSVSAETREEQTFGGSEIASAREECGPPPLPRTPRPCLCQSSPRDGQQPLTPIPVRGAELLWVLPWAPSLHRKTAPSLNA